MFGIKKGNALNIVITIFTIIVITFLITGKSKNNLTIKGFGLEIPPAVGYVNDFADIISIENEQNLNLYLKELEKKTGAEIAVATLNSLKGNNIEDVALDIGRKWAVGEKGKDNGIVILVSTGDKQMRIEVGYGLEGIIPDGKAGRIRDEYMIPFFKQDNIEQGIINGTIAVSSIIASSYNVELPSSFNVSPFEMSYSNNTSSRKTPVSNLIAFILFIIFYIILPRRGIFTYGYTDYGRGFGGSNGFGGFGGGSFGGGGSSGRW